jgi:hypothetical protein
MGIGTSLRCNRTQGDAMRCHAMPAYRSVGSSMHANHLPGREPNRGQVETHTLWFATKKRRLEVREMTIQPHRSPTKCIPPLPTRPAA